MSGPWFYVIPVIVNGGGSIRPGTSTDLHFYPGSDIQLDSPITSKSWVWASIAEISSDDSPFLGAAPMWVANVVPEYEGTSRNP